MYCVKDMEQIAGNSVMVQFHLFQGEGYLGWDCFSKGTVTVGTSNRADLVLPVDSDRALGTDEISAIFNISSLGVSVTDASTNKQVTVSGNPADAHVLGPLDYVKIGPYSIKVKVKPMAPAPDPVTAATEEMTDKVTDPFSTPIPFLPEDIEAAAEDDDVEASFRLKDLLHSGSEALGRGGQVLEVVRTWKDTVVDVQFLREKEKYFAPDSHGRFCLAVHKKGNFYFFFNDRFAGHQQQADGSEQTTESLKAGSKLISKRKRLYRNQVPAGAEIVLSDGQFDYLLRRSIKEESPQVTLQPREKTTFRKNLFQASSLHVIFLMVVGFFFSLPTIKHVPLPEERFVRIDATQFIKPALPPVKKELPKKAVVKKTAPKPKPKAPKKQVQPRKQVPPRKQVAGRKANPKAVAAGGKKGNVVTKDVKQTGMLAILGNAAISLQPSETMAAVTNLDAVSAPSQGRGGYKVSGVVASLGDAKIELPSSGGIVATQGSATVLRTGTHGEGQVAALKAGATGQRQVQSVVTATLDKNVKVQGGITREDVKRVIDQHLDEIQYCYESALLNNPSIMGKLVLEWKILSDGSVGETPIKSSTLNSSSMTGCVRNAVQSWRFPKPRGTDSVMVSYPFIFDIVGF